MVRNAVGEFGMKCVGIEDSFEGFWARPRTTNLTTKSVSGILRAAVLSWKREIREARKDGQRQAGVTECRLARPGKSRYLGIEALIVLGGEGTLAIAEQFHNTIPVIALPKTIDNDLAATTAYVRIYDGDRHSNRGA